MLDYVEKIIQNHLILDNVLFFFIKIKLIITMASLNYYDKLYLRMNITITMNLTLQYVKT